MWSIVSIAVLGLFASVARADVSIEGVLLEKGTRRPLPGLNVFLLPERRKALTDNEGNFKFEGVAPGEIQWIVNSPGFRKLERMDSVPADATGELSRTFYLEKESYQIYETTIVDQEKKRDSTTKTLKREEFLSAPGSGGDPVKAVQNLPGVNRPPSFSSQIVIQGAGPQDTRYALEGQEIPLAFHFGGLTSVVIPEAVERVDLLSAGYGPEYGRANGGWISLGLRSPRRDRMHGLVFADLFSAGGLVEGPMGEDGGFLLSARQSYFGAVLGSVFKDNEDFNLTVAPAYSDVTLVLEKRLSPIDDFKWVSLYSRDGLEFLLPEPVDADPTLRGSFKTGTSFFRLIPQLTHRHGANTVSRWSVGLGRDWIFFETNDNHFDLASTTLSSRDEIEHRFSSAWIGFFGVDLAATAYRISLDVPLVYSAGGVANPVSTAATRQSSVEGRGFDIGFFQRNEIRPEGWRLSLLPNARMDYFGRTRQWLFSPRPAAKYDWGNGTMLRSSGGLYFQPPQPEQTDPVFGNPEIQAPRAWHLTAGVEKDFREGRSEGWVVSGDGFYKFLDQVVSRSTDLVIRDGQLVPENYTNDGRGRAFGFQTQLKYQNAVGSVSAAYTLSRSTRWNNVQPEAVYAYDQTHLLGLVGSLELGSNWRLSSRLRYSTGNPTTPLEGGVFDADNDIYIPVRGAYFSERLDPFYQLDLRLDKKWVYDTWIFSFYIDIQNATNRKNPEQVNYSYDYSQREVVSGLPVLPTLGVKGEF